ncbi:hypothetical protein [Fulvivirga ligni]|uniref:hypothetical protein n=1 Tax=Fulvivirga ligni TaxID=2904246 RepID=UPI001F260576|nr:hypothetical protein [Fulvivirga ligni]UII20317.1 hypothetical protein LVD16_20970 [Fulvivirga ligni]
MIRVVIAVMLGLCMISCGGKNGEGGFLSGIVDVSESEREGVKEVVEFYGGTIDYSFGRSMKSGEESKTFFEIRLSDSESLEKYKSTPEIPASNIAYRTYRHLTAEERKKYSHINPVLVFANGDEYEFEYNTWILEYVDKRMALVDKVVGLLKKKQYDALSGMLNDTSAVAQYSKEEWIKGVMKADSTFGNITEDGFILQGYKIDAIDNKGNDYLYIYGIITRDVENNQFSVVLDPYSESDEIYLIDYALH